MGAARRGLLMPKLSWDILMDTLMLWLHLPLLLPIQMELLSLQSPRMLLMLELNIWQLLLRLAVRRDQLMPRLFLDIHMDTPPTLMPLLHLPLLLPIQTVLLFQLNPKMLLMPELNPLLLLLRQFLPNLKHKKFTPLHNHQYRLTEIQYFKKIK